MGGDLTDFVFWYAHLLAYLSKNPRNFVCGDGPVAHWLEAFGDIGLEVLIVLRM